MLALCAAADKKGCRCGLEKIAVPAPAAREVRCYGDSIRRKSMSLTSRAALRSQVLRDALLSTIDLLERRRASEIDEQMIDDYVALDWLEWNGGALRLTVTGQNVRRQLMAQLEQP
jgi:hypothetical protein